MKRAAPLAVLNLRFRLSALCQRGVGGDRNESVEHGVEPFDSSKAGLVIGSSVSNAHSISRRDNALCTAAEHAVQLHCGANDSCVLTVVRGDL